MQTLYKAGEGKLGTDESGFFNILTGRTYDHLNVVFDEYKKGHSQGRNGMDRALCDTILKFGMMLGLGKSFSKTTDYKLAEHPGGR